MPDKAKEKSKDKPIVSFDVEDKETLSKFKPDQEVIIKVRGKIKELIVPNDDPKGDDVDLPAFPGRMAILASDIQIEEFNIFGDLIDDED